MTSRGRSRHTPAVTGTRTLAAGLAALGLSVALAGCSGAGSAQENAARQVATTFADAAQEDPSSACGLLAPDTREELEDTSGPCAESLAEAGLPQAGPVLDVEVYGLDAMVRLEDDTMFLALFDTGWRVTAAGCTPEEPDRPYSCDIKGA